MEDGVTNPKGQQYDGSTVQSEKEKKDNPQSGQAHCMQRANSRPLMNDKPTKHRRKQYNKMK
jgi:hypothetical protein